MSIKFPIEWNLETARLLGTDAFTTFCKGIEDERDRALHSMLTAPSDQLEQIRGYALALDQVLKGIAKSREISQKHRS